MHWAEANHKGLDYLGTGVNQAARISATAAADEILVSAPTLAAARGRYAEDGRRTVQLKGLAEPVEVVPIAWR